MVIRNMKYYVHPKDGSFNYRIENSGHSLVFATDVEQYAGTDQRLIKFAEGCDVFIHDSQYTLEQYLNFQGYGHSNYEMACEAALKAKAKKLLLFHHDPNNDDEQEFERPGLGSGVIVKKLGNKVYVVTNNHVVGSADKISIRLYDAKNWRGLVYG